MRPPHLHIPDKSGLKVPASDSDCFHHDTDSIVGKPLY